MIERQSDRYARITTLVEEILVEIADEHVNPLMTAPAMVEFFSEIQMRLTRMSHERLADFLMRKGHPDD